MTHIYISNLLFFVSHHIYPQYSLNKPHFHIFLLFFYIHEYKKNKLRWVKRSGVLFGPARSTFLLCSILHLNNIELIVTPRPERGRVEVESINGRSMR